MSSPVCGCVRPGPAEITNPSLGLVCEGGEMGFMSGGEFKGCEVDSDVDILLAYFTLIRQQNSSLRRGENVLGSADHKITHGCYRAPDLLAI